jgi:hypothetical protein
MHWRLESRPLNMLYQVLMRSSSVAQWRCATPPTSDLHRARAHLHIARRYAAEAMLVAVENLSEHAKVTQRRSDAGAAAACAQASAPPPPAEATATPSNWQEYHADRRWELERGPGGDHDEPYQFEAPTSEMTRRIWARLLARTQHECAAVSTSSV